MKQQLELAVQAAIQHLYSVESPIELSRPEEKFGDYATNAALQLARQLGKNPREIAEELAAQLRSDLADQLSEVSIAGPGFINLRLQPAALLAASAKRFDVTQTLAGQTIVAEYSDPNPFKVLHAGHLYTSIVGEAISNLLEVAGAEVHRVNFGGDVGLHVGKTMWAIIQELGGEYPDKLAAIEPDQRLEWLSKLYVRGTNAYADSEQAKADIIAYNKQVYELHAAHDHESAFAQIYWTCRTWSYDGFDTFYDRIGSHFEKYYPESVTAPIGLQTVREQLARGVYQESDGAVIFDGDKYGLHTRVFINSQGLPTYETKDVGLIIAKWNDYHFDRSVIMTGNDIIEYMKVVLKSIEQFAPELATRTTHVTHGIVKMAGGVKMSSRLGNILRAADVLDAAGAANLAATATENPQAVLGAVKYAFLKPRIGADIIYDPVESVAIIGNTGPYLQYAHARARSILAKAPTALAGLTDDLQPAERSLLRKVTEYPEVINLAVRELMPHHICSYLYELAQAFNSFYEHNRVIGDPRQSQRLALVSAYADTLARGLGLLGITAPDSM